MALFRIPLLINKQLGFWKLLGCGKNGAFDIHPDWRQWGILGIYRELLSKRSKIQTTDHKLLYGSFINAWWQFFRCETYTIVLEPIEGHGTWDGKKVFGDLPKQTAYEDIIAILTRATIRLNRLKRFWQHVDSVASKMNSQEGFITSVGIGEIPWIRQATFSVWQSKKHMKDFAYTMAEHKAVIHKTRTENWYREDMFIRFKILGSYGTLHGVDPLRKQH
jgi:hypothetical protein